VVIARARAGRYGALSHVGVRLWTTYWHFATLVWLLMYLPVYWF
jgi:heme/copper-type cytochrome/quinol oxidase subunit 3